MGYRQAPNPEGKTTVSHYSTLPRHSEASVSRIIDDVQPTSETLTGRAGLSLFVRYVRGIGLYPHLDRLFGSLRKSRKGQPVTEIFKQLLCFLLDGSSRHLVSFDALKEDAGYGGAIETKPEALLFSHAVKRFFGRFSMWRIWLFRRLLQQLFLWRLRLQQPPLILLGMDTMVMDNDEAPQRHGVAPTYKRVKGFQPLQVTWGRLLIDAVFRGGDKHSNHADTAPKTLSHLIQKIRRKYRSDVPIIVRLDSGFFDQKLLQVLETLEVGYLVAGKLYGDVQQYILKLSRNYGSSRLRLRRGRAGESLATAIRSGTMWNWETGGAAGTSSAGPCSAGWLMRTGSAFWPLPAPIRSCTPISVAAAPWTSSSGKRGCSVGFKRKPFCKAIRDGEPTS